MADEHDKLIKQSCKKLQEAIAASGKTQGEVFEHIGIRNASQVSQILDPTNRKCLQAHLIGKFCEAVGNTIYIDWTHTISGLKTKQEQITCAQDSAMEIKELKQKLARYEKYIFESAQKGLSFLAPKFSE